MTLKYEIQDSQYNFPYHYLVDFGNYPYRMKLLKWGFEYMCYVEEICSITSSISPNSILEVGCGDGRLLYELSLFGFRNCTGVDISSRAINFAKAFCVDFNFFNDNVENCTKKYDVIILCEVLEHIPDEYVNTFLSSVYEKLEDGGTLIISVPSSIRKVHKKHYRHYDKAMLFNTFVESGISLKAVNQIKYIFKDNNLYKLYLRVLMNRYWNISIKVFEKIEMKIVRYFLKYANESNGAHIIITVDKI